MNKHKAYGSQKIRDYITEQKARYTIPPKENCADPWPCDFHTYKERHLVECFFNKLKVFRRAATRYDKLAVSFLMFQNVAPFDLKLRQKINGRTCVMHLTAGEQEMYQITQTIDNSVDFCGLTTPGWFR